jgi:neutral ceramidase
VSALRAALLASSLGFALACTTFTVHVPERELLPSAMAASGLRAGAARVDLTPIPGVPLGGFSIAAKVSRGFWTRLWARALYLEAPDGTALALVATELMIVPEGLADQVVALLHEDGATRHIGRENLMLAATETHQSPGNFFTSSFYNDFSSPRTGFDRELFDFLARRIADAVKQAVAGRMPAVLRVNHAESATYTSRIGQLFRNRSFDAFLRNPEAERYLLGNANVPECATSTEYPHPQACWAVHPRVDFLELVAADVSGAPTCKGIALAVFLAAHSTVLGPEVEVYSGDFFGAAASLVEQAAFADPGCPGGGVRFPVAPVFNGAQGDVSLVWDPKRRTRGEVLELADRLVAKLRTLLPGRVEPLATLGFQYERVGPLADMGVQEVSKGIPPREHRTAKEPMVGNSMLGGAEEGRSLLYEVGLAEGLRDILRDEHGMKSPPGRVRVGPFLMNPASLMFGMSAPPTATPIGVYRIGKTVLVAVPGELTTMMGERVRSRVAAAAGGTVERVLVVGFGNGYLSYLTTPEEYDAQHYEGGFDLYGAATGPFLMGRLENLAQKLAPDPVTGLPPKPPLLLPSESHTYSPGWADRFRVDPEDLGLPAYFLDDGLGMIAHGPPSPPELGGLRELPDRTLPTFCWDDAIPRLEDKACHDRFVPDVEVRKDGDSGPYADPVRGLPHDNRHLNVVTLVGEVGWRQADGQPLARWCAIWLPDDASSATKYRFHVTPIRGTEKLSDGFLPTDHVVGPLADDPLDPPGIEPLTCVPPLDTLGLCTYYCQDPG